MRTADVVLFLSLIPQSIRGTRTQPDGRMEWRKHEHAESKREREVAWDTRVY